MDTNEVDDRVRCLETAKGYVTQDRTSAYGSPEDNFGNIAAIWSAQGVTVNGRGVTAADVALMMIGMKLARLKHNPTHEDSWIDAAGYAACGMRAANVSQRLNDEAAAQWAEMHPAGTLPGDTEGLLEFTPVAEARRTPDGDGWISHNRCGLNSDHPAHSYKDKSQWCDGYVTDPDRRRVAQDVRTVERVADSQRACGGKEPHHNC